MTCPLTPAHAVRASAAPCPPFSSARTLSTTTLILRTRLKHSRSFLCLVRTNTALYFIHLVASPDTFGASCVTHWHEYRNKKHRHEYRNTPTLLHADSILNAFDRPRSKSMIGKDGEGESEELDTLIYLVLMEAEGYTCTYIPMCYWHKIYARSNYWKSGK